MQNNKLSPTFIPPFLGQEIKSSAEQKMFDVLQGLELENAYVLHSLGLPRHKSKIYGEIDFVVVCELGVACLEIKGGRVECRDGKWFFMDRNNKEHTRPEGPFSQVVGNMFSLKTVLNDKFKSKPFSKGLLLASGVVFPDISFESNSSEVIKEIVYDKRTSNITQYINKIFTYWKGRNHGKASKLSPSEVKEIVQFLRGDFSFVPLLSDRLNEVESRLIRLTNEQAKVMDALGVNNHLMIQGNAGTGKTLLALDFALKKANDGMKVLYLAYNKNLVNSLKRNLGDKKPDSLDIINIHALFGDYINVDTELMNENPQKYFAETLPELFFEYLSNLDEASLSEMQYDLIVLDEGQDIIKPEYLYSIDLLLKNGLENGNWAAFYDNKQNIYNPSYEEGLEILESYNSTKFTLFVNCRNTVQIGKFASKVTGVEITEFIRENGEEVRVGRYENDAGFEKRIRAILDELKNEKISMDDVIFLGPKKYSGSILKRIGIEVNELKDDFVPNKKLPQYATIQGFKGLDSKIVILIDIEKIREENFQQFLYIGITRARTLLYVLGENESMKFTI
ncbi:MAG: NERD domain-containing protein [Lachnospiraceae bacterium]|nr:NERD domain-containing protein [Lachnospiraceae bacterium]